MSTTDSSENGDQFEHIVFKYTHRILLLLFVGTLIGLGLAEAYKRIEQAFPFPSPQPGRELRLDRDPHVSVPLVEICIAQRHAGKFCQPQSESFASHIAVPYF